jgi:hemoglobin
VSSLYERLDERLGGEKAVDAAVAIFYRKALADGRIARFFDSVDMERQATKQKAFLTMVFGGPANYSGQDMRQGHKHLVAKGLNDSYVDAALENLATTLRQLGVAEKDVQEVNALANSVRNDVLNR